MKKKHSMEDSKKLEDLVLAPYIIKATALIGKPRKVGGNQFRHALATMAILLDYKMFDEYILLKAAVIHDLFEDVPETNEAEMRKLDDQANDVVNLAMEVSRPKGKSKAEFLKNILENGSPEAKTLKVADRISNLTDLHRDLYDKRKMRQILNETEKYILPMAKEVNEDMAVELKDLIDKRRKMLNFFKYPDFIPI